MFCQLIIQTLLPGFNLKNKDTKDNIMTERTNNDLQYTSDKVNQLLAHGQWFSPCKLIATSSTTTNNRHDIVEILLKVALSIKNQSINLATRIHTQI